LRRNPGQDLIAATSLTRFARLYAQHGRPDAESELLGLAAAIRENTLGSWHPETIAGLTDLGRALERQGRIADALIAFRKAAIATSEWLALASSDVTPVQNASGVFHDVIRSAHAAARLHPQLAAALSEETFQWAQWMAQTSASAALGQMAARFSVGASAFAQQIRELQDRQRDYQVLDRQLIQALGSPTGQSDQAVEMLRAKLVKAEKRIAELTASISLANPNYADFANARPISLQTAQRLLGANEALVFLLIPASKSAGPLDAYGWLTTQDNSRWLRLSIGGPDITADVQALRCGLDRSNWREGSKFREICKTLLGTEPANDQPPLFDAAAAHALYRELFGGVEDLIKDKSLLIVPSGPLTQLPFETLVTEKPDGTLPRFEAYKKAAWLGQRQAITILPSVGSLKALRTAKASAAAAPFIGFGNPLLDGRNRNDKSAWAKQTCAKPSGRERSRTADRAADIASLLREGQVNVESLRHQPPLPETADELCAVAKTLGVPEARLDDAVYLGERATVSQVKAKSKSGELARARVVHFATHGLLAGQTAMFAQNKAEPALLLTPPATASEEDNGLLTASEVAQLNLNADWVVMSACNTAAGSNEGAEALSGLARAFFYAGARSLLVSHWAVDSEAAVAITTGAVNAMKAEPRIGRAEALRRSIAALIAKGGNNAHPSVWAPFVLVGNGEQ
jgi:CHAT domain-containing protein